MSLLRWYDAEPGFITFNDVARIFDDAVTPRSQPTRAAHTFTSGFTPK